MCYAIQSPILRFKTMEFLLMEQYIKNTEMHTPLCKPKQSESEYDKKVRAVNLTQFYIGIKQIFRFESLF